MSFVLLNHVVCVLLVALKDCGGVHQASPNRRSGVCLTIECVLSPSNVFSYYTWYSFTVKASVCVRERVSVIVRERELLCVCACVWKRERARANESEQTRESESERVRSRELHCVWERASESEREGARGTSPRSWVSDSFLCSIFFMCCSIILCWHANLSLSVWRHPDFFEFCFVIVLACPFVVSVWRHPVCAPHRKTRTSTLCVCWRSCTGTFASFFFYFPFRLRRSLFLTLLSTWWICWGGFAFLFFPSTTEDVSLSVVPLVHLLETWEV